MPEKYHAQIDQSQKEVMDIKKNAPNEISNKMQITPATLITAVDIGQTDLRSVYSSVESKNAKDYVSNSAQEILGYVRGVAANGREILVLHKKGKEVSEDKYLLIGQLKERLKGDLNNQKAELQRFRQGKRSLGKLSALKNRLTNWKNTKDSAAKKIYEGDNLIKFLKEEVSNVPEFLTDQGIAFSQEILAQYDTVKLEIEERLIQFNKVSIVQQYPLCFTINEYGEISGYTSFYYKLPIEEQLRIKSIVEKKSPREHFEAQKQKVLKWQKEVDDFDSLLKKYERSPSDELLVKLLQRNSSQTPAAYNTLSNEVFGNDLHASEGPVINGLYQGLWEKEFKTLISKLEEICGAVERIENKRYTENAKKALTDLEKHTVLISDLEKTYDEQSKKLTFTPEQQAAFKALESGLIKALLVAKGVASPFLSAGVSTKVEFETLTKLQEKVKSYNALITKIEQVREKKKNFDDIEKLNLSEYVSFIDKEDEGKGYTFTSEINKLGPDEQDRIKLQVEFIVNKNKEAVKAETAMEGQSIEASYGDLDSVAKRMGEKAAKYIEALRLSREGKREESLAAFQEFLKQASSFSGPEKDKYKNAIEYAQNQINTLKESEKFFEAMALLKGKSPLIDTAYGLFRDYIAAIEKMGSEKMEAHADQLSAAKEAIRQIATLKVQNLDDLLEDVIKWKQSQVQYRLNELGTKHDVRVEGAEVGELRNHIGKLRERIMDGEIVDFEKEFSDIKAKVREFNKEKAINSEDNIVDKLDELHRKFNDPNIHNRRNAWLEFAKELRGMESFDLAREYLDKVLADEYAKAAKEVSRESVLQRMLADPDVMKDIKTASKSMYDQYKRENPGVDLEKVYPLSKFEQIVLNQKLSKAYTRELRHNMTLRGLDTGASSIPEALKIYNKSLPYLQKDKGFWGDLQFSRYTDEEYAELKVTIQKEVALFVAMLPLGFGAGAAGVKATQLTLRTGARFLFRKAAVTAAEKATQKAAIAAIEKGGILALRQGSKAFRALEPAVQQMIIKHQAGLAGTSLLATGVGVSTEAAIFHFGGGAISSSFEDTPAHASNSIWEALAKSLLYRGVGRLGARAFGRIAERGGRFATAARVADEALISTPAGLVIEGASLALHGQGSQIDAGWMLSEILQNAAQAGAYHYGGKAFRKPDVKPTAVKIEPPKPTEGGEKKEPRKVRVTPGFRGSQYEAPKRLKPSERAKKRKQKGAESPTTVRPPDLPPAGRIRSDRNTMLPPPPETSVATTTGERPSSPPVKDKGSDSFSPGDWDYNPNQWGDRPDTPSVAPSIPKPPRVPSLDRPTQPPSVRPPKPSESVVPRPEPPEVNRSMPTEAPGRARRPVDDAELPPHVRELLPDEPPISREKATENFHALENSDNKEDVENHKKVMRALEKSGKKLEDLDPNEIRILTESENLPETVVEKIVNGEHGEFRDVIGGQEVIVRYYLDEGSTVGEGGLNTVNEGYCVAWNVSGQQSPGNKLIKAAVRVSKSEKAAANFYRENEINTQRTVRMLPDGSGIVETLFVGRTANNDIVSVTRIINRYPGAEGTTLKDTLKVAPANETFHAFADAWENGMSKMHKKGLQHGDLKPVNFFAGLDSTGKYVVVVGDLAAIPFSNINDFTFVEMSASHFEESNSSTNASESPVRKPRRRQREKYQVFAHETSGQGIGTVYFNDRAYKHIRAAQEWQAKYGSEDAPEVVVSLMDLGQLTATLETMQAIMDKNPPKGVTLAKIAEAQAKIDALIADIDKGIPDMDALNAEISAAKASGDPNRIQAAIIAKEEAIKDMKYEIITGKEVAARMRLIGDILRPEDRASTMPPPPDQATTKPPPPVPADRRTTKPPPPSRPSLEANP